MTTPSLHHGTGMAQKHVAATWVFESGRISRAQRNVNVLGFPWTHKQNLFNFEDLYF